MEEKENKSLQKEKSFSQSSYRFSLAVRILIIIVVSVFAVLTALLVFPLAKLMDVDLAHLQGIGFQLHSFY